MLRSLTLPVLYRRSRHFPVHAFATRSRLCYANLREELRFVFLPGGAPREKSPEHVMAVAFQSALVSAPMVVLV
jgi:hypothetical protein